MKELAQLTPIPSGARCAAIATERLGYPVSTSTGHRWRKQAQDLQDGQA